MIFTTQIHACLDYASGAVLPVLPRALGWEGSAQTVCDAASGAALCYSVATDYEGGVVKVLPMTTHLVLDAVWGTSLLAASVFLTDAPPAARWTLAAFGVVGLVAAVATETAPRP